MANWNGYRKSKAAGGGLYNGYVTPKAKQDWSIGSLVNIGFVKGLEVLSKIEGSYSLRQASTGRDYTFTPHVGLVREGV